MLYVNNVLSRLQQTPKTYIGLQVIVITTSHPAVGPWQTTRGSCVNSRPNSSSSSSRSATVHFVTRRPSCSLVAGDRSVVLVSINEVNPRRARLVLEWVNMSGFNSRCRTFISERNQPPRSTQPGHPFVNRRNESINQRAVTPCGWRVKAGMVRAWFAGKTL